MDTAADNLDRRVHVAARLRQVVDYVFFLIYGLIAIEIFLELAGARDANPFKRFMDVITLPFLAPFHGLFHDPAIGSFRLMFSYIAALLVWALVHIGIRGMLRIIGTRPATP